MKRDGKIIVLMISACLILTGCQPITEAPIVMPKSAMNGAKIIDEELSGDIANQVQAPKHYKTEFTDKSGRIEIFVDADIEVPEGQGIRLKKSEVRVFGQSDEEKLKKALLHKKPLWKRKINAEEGVLLTKDEIIEIQEEYIRKMEADSKSLEAQGIEFNGEYWDDQMRYWDERWQKAPEEIETEEVPLQIHYNPKEAETEMPEELIHPDNENTIKGNVTLAGQDYNFYLDNNWSNRRKAAFLLFTKALYNGSQNIDAYTTGTWGDISFKVDREKAKKQGKELLEQLGLEAMEIAGQKSCMKIGYDEMAMLSNPAVNFYYTRVIDGIPINYVDKRANAKENKLALEWEAVPETVAVAFDEDGMAQFLWINPSEISDISDDYVFLMPFSEIQKTFEREAASMNAILDFEMGESKQIMIDKISLGYMRLQDGASDKDGILIPVWDFMGKESLIVSGNTEEEWASAEALNTTGYADGVQYRSFLTINAMDGTVVDTPVTYYQW